MLSLDDQFPASAMHAQMLSGPPTIGLRFKAILTAGMLLLIMTIAVAIMTIRENLAAQQSVITTNQIIACATELGERASSRELTLRNYLRTGDGSFSEEYEALDQETTVLGKRLVALVVDNPAQAEQAGRLHTLVNERSLKMDAIIKEYAPASSERLLAANVTSSSIVQEAMQSAMSTLRTEEQRILEQGQVRLVRSANRIVILIPLNFAGLLVLLGCQLVLVRHLNQTYRVDAEAQAAKLMVNKANEFKTAFLANVSHEIRTPLAAILGYAHMLRSDEISTPQERDEFLCAIRSSGEQVLTIVNDILDLSKMESGRMTTEQIPCAIVDLIADIASLFRRMAAHRGLSFEVQYIGILPKQIRTDPTRLRQILMNLVGNAVKFTERGGVRLVVDLLHEADTPPMLRVRVIDTGIGVSPEVASTLFQPFIQADISPTRRFGGTGLGLTISRHFAELLGGTISVESKVGSGSTFSLTIATGDLNGVRMMSGIQDVIHEARAPVDAKVPRLDGRRVLVVEDSLDNQRIILFHLRKTGAEITVAENGKIAVQLVTEMADTSRPFDLILMDMQMPVMDGYTATTTLRNLRYIGPIVALTANAMASDRQKCLTAGCSGFISKPIQWPLFWATVRRFVTEASEATASVRAGALLPALAAIPVLTEPDAGGLSSVAHKELAQPTQKFATALPGL